MTGQLLGDRYQVGDTLGFGGMSEVHRGRDLRLGRDVAIKVLAADLARDPSFQTRFRREAQNAASLNHPAIVAVYDTGETAVEIGTVPYIVMEYVDGETLRDLLKREGSLQPARAMEIVADVCAALDFSHRHGIVHRDIKPANVMLTRAGAVKVMDFGIARAVADGQATMTATAAVIGTAQYLSPEQARGEAVDARSDVYATGCVLFELLVGGPLFTGDSPVAVAYQHVREEPKAPSEVRPELPRELDSIVLKALNKNPLNRYQTASEMRADLVRALSGQAVHATPLLSDDDRTQLMRPTPERVGLAVASVPSLLALPRRGMADEIWDDEEPDRSKRVWGFVGVGVLCLALLAGAIYLTMKFTDTGHPVAQVLAPQVEQLALAKAEHMITDAGLTVGTIIPVESTAPNGSVTKQNPSQDTPIDKGKPITLEVSKGISQVAVPNLATLSQDAAQAQLDRLGLVGNATQKPSTDAEWNFVLKDQNPAAGVSVEPGTTVNYSVGSGPVYTKVPTDLVGKSFDQAVAELRPLNLDAIAKQVDGVQPKNTVLKVDPVNAVDGAVIAGSRMTLQVSNNNLFVVPNLANLTVDEAIYTLTTHGWTETSADFRQLPAATTNLSVIGLIPSDPQQVTMPDANSVATAAPQTPAPGHTVGKAEPFTVVVFAKAQVTVPSFTVGVTTRADIENAQSQTGANNWTIQTWPPAPTPDLEGTFNSISPAPESQVPFDTAVTITVFGPATPPPPPSTPPPSTPPPPPPPPPPSTPPSTPPPPPPSTPPSTPPPPPPSTPPSTPPPPPPPPPSTPPPPPPSTPPPPPPSAPPPSAPTTSTVPANTAGSTRATVPAPPTAPTPPPTTNP